MNSQKSRLGLFAALFSMFVFAAVACGGDDNGNGNGNGTTDGGGTTADAGMTDGGGSADGGTTDGGGTADGGMEEDTGNNGGGTMMTGNVNLIQTRTEAAGQTTIAYSGSASFTEVESSGDGSGSCETTEEGSCSVQVCDTGNGNGGETTYRSAGEITVSGGAQEITMTKDGDTYSTSGTGEVWNNSHDLTVEAAGDVVPMFSGEISPAANATLNSPDTPGTGEGAWTVDTTSDITVEWDTTDIDSGQFTVQLSNSSDSQSSTLSCNWDATSGSETIPSSLLGEMITGESGSYNFGVGAQASVTAEDWDVSINALESVDSGQATYE